MCAARGVSRPVQSWRAGTAASPDLSQPTGASVLPSCWRETADHCPLPGTGCAPGSFAGLLGPQGKGSGPRCPRHGTARPGLPAARVPGTPGRHRECAHWAACPPRERRWEVSRGQGCPFLSCLEGGRENETHRLCYCTSRLFVLISDTHLLELLKMNYTSYRNRTLRDFHSSSEN